jgi:hypothetical protein
MLDAGLAAQRNPSRLRNAFEGTPQQKAAGNAGENTRTTESMFAPGERPISSASSQEEQKPGLTQAEQNRINRMFAPEDD